MNMFYIDITNSFADITNNTPQMNNLTTPDKRSTPRLQIPDYIVAFEQIAGRGYGDIKDISSGGMRIKTMEKIEVGAVTMQFKLPSFPTRKTVHGHVVWTNQNTFTYGISFHQILSSDLLQKKRIYSANA